MTKAAILGRLMIAFEGESVPDRIAQRLADAPLAGVTLFRAHNVRSAAQVRELTDELRRRVAAGQAARAVQPRPLLIAADQEGGQLIALGDDTTAFAGNMALGAVDDPDLTERVGAAIGREARALGVNVVYAPVLDLATEPANPALGIRSFGDDPAAVGRHGAAMIRGLQSAGVAATMKHFPGLGDVVQDTHHRPGIVGGSRADLERGLAPFRAAISTGARMAMSAHVAVPSLTDHPDLPATLSRRVMRALLRDDLGFDGVSISDAFDMAALHQGLDQAVDVIAAIRAGIDLLLAAADPVALERIEQTLATATARGLFEHDELGAASRRLDRLHEWLTEAEPQPGLDIVGAAGHRSLARELATRALTRIDHMPDRAEPGTVIVSASARILAVMPEPADLTPADTSSYVDADLGRALRTRFPVVESVVVAVEPSVAEISALRDRAGDFDTVVVGTIEAHRRPAQADLVRALSSSGTSTTAIALRTPWDATIYPSDVPAIATYSILPDSLEALAAALIGEVGLVGRSPVALWSASE
jgi:beta-N-acetylhexosaminidase